MVKIPSYVRYLATSLFVLTALTNAPAAQATGTAPLYETVGILATPTEGQIAPDIWAGTTRQDAVLLVNALPARYSSPTYFRLAERFLLSDAPPLPNSPKLDDPTRPDLLIARLDKLLEIGALRAAEELYENTVEAVPENFDLALRSLQVLMLRGEFPAACLDLQTMQSKHGTDRRWRELNALCMIKFAQGTDRNKLIADTTFESFPVLDRLLKGGITPSRLPALNTSELAFANALDFVGEPALRQLTSKAGSLPSLLLAVLYETQTQAASPEKTCLAIESVRRGLLPTRDLITLYERPHYDATLLLDNIGQAPANAANIHPCMIPTVLHQRVASHAKHPDRDVTIRTAFDVMGKMPDAAFLPMALYLKDMDINEPKNHPYMLRAARIVAYERDELPESWRKMAQPKTADQGTEGNKGQGADNEARATASPVWLVHAIVDPDLATPELLESWRQKWPNLARSQAARDPYLPVILGRAAMGDVAAGSPAPKNRSQKGGDYDNQIPLTFSRTYAMPSYGLTQRLKNVIEKGQTGQSVALLLIGYGAIPPDQVIPDQMAQIIEGLNKQGLRGDARRLSLEILR